MRPTTLPALCAVALVPVAPHLRLRRGGPLLLMAVPQDLPEGNDALFSAVVDSDERSGSLDLLRATMAENERLKAKVDELTELVDRTEGLCEVLDDGGGWTSSIKSRASWLLGLLICQSCSSFILADNEQLLVAHPVVIYFMTMLVGAGGNAGNQAAVRIIRGLATGEVDAKPTARTTSIISDELRRAVALGVILVVAGFVRVVFFDATVVDAAAISASLFIIVSLSVVLGTVLPLLLTNLRVDAAHASTTIQVIMDVMGVLITCTVAPLVFQLAASSGWDWLAVAAG